MAPKKNGGPHGRTGARRKRGPRGLVRLDGAAQRQRFEKMQAEIDDLRHQQDVQLKRIAQLQQQVDRLAAQNRSSDERVS